MNPETASAVTAGMVFEDFALPPGHKKASFKALYSELALYKAVLHVYAKPLFSWRKALSMSHDGRTLYEFARHTPEHVEQLHCSLVSHQFRFREGVELHRNLNGKHRVFYIFPWEERIVDLLLYQVLVKSFHSVFAKDSYAYRYRGFGVDLCQHRVSRRLREMPRPVYFIKRDVADYFPSVDHEILLTALGQWVEPEDYLWQLLEERVKFEVRTPDGTKVAERGIPFGTAIACFFANLYLTPLDRQLGSVPGLAYHRYADDILAFSSSRRAIVEASEGLDRAFETLRLTTNPKHHLDFVFGAGATPDNGFVAADKFRHLGLEFRWDNSIGLSRDKARKVRNLFRFAFKRVRRKLDRLQDPQQRAELLVSVAKDLVENGFRAVALIDYYLKHIDDEAQLELLDRWLAEEVVAQALQTGHRKGNFRRLPFRQLRKMGLPSLRHRRRLLRHGKLVSSFFVLRTEKLVDRERRRLQGRLDLFPMSRSSGIGNLVGKGAACR